MLRVDKRWRQRLQLQYPPPQLLSSRHPLQTQMLPVEMNCRTVRLRLRLLQLRVKDMHPLRHRLHLGQWMRTLDKQLRLLPLYLPLR